jgi:CheY-like chemotaxis protein
MTSGKTAEKRVLIADDEDSIRRLVSSILGKDYLILKAEDGQEALDIARLQQPDLILMDIMMPRMDGYSACAALKKDPQTAHIPVVMLTGVGHQLNKVLAEQMGADDYVTKPFGLAELRALTAKFFSPAT